MKKILISLLFLVVSSVAFADTLTVIKGGAVTDKTFAVKYKNMKMSKSITPSSLKNNEYMLVNSGLYYKVDGKCYLTSMYEVEFE